jgi:hypothetical protein
MNFLVRVDVRMYVCIYTRVHVYPRGCSNIRALKANLFRRQHQNKLGKNYEIHHAVGENDTNNKMSIKKVN